MLAMDDKLDIFKERLKYLEDNFNLLLDLRTSIKSSVTRIEKKSIANENLFKNAIAQEIKKLKQENTSFLKVSDFNKQLSQLQLRSAPTWQQESKLREVLKDLLDETRITSDLDKVSRIADHLNNTIRKEQEERTDLSTQLEKLDKQVQQMEALSKQLEGIPTEQLQLSQAVDQLRKEVKQVPSKEELDQQLALELDKRLNAFDIRIKENSRLAKEANEQIVETQKDSKDKIETLKREQANFVPQNKLAEALGKLQKELESNQENSLKQHNRNLQETLLRTIDVKVESRLDVLNKDEEINKIKQELKAAKTNHDQIHQAIDEVKEATGLLKSEAFTEAQIVELIEKELQRSGAAEQKGMEEKIAAAVAKATSEMTASISKLATQYQSLLTSKDQEIEQLKTEITNLSGLLTTEQQTREKAFNDLQQALTDLQQKEESDVAGVSDQIKLLEEKDQQSRIEEIEKKLTARIEALPTQAQLDDLLKEKTKSLVAADELKVLQEQIDEWLALKQNFVQHTELEKKLIEQVSKVDLPGVDPEWVKKLVDDQMDAAFPAKKVLDTVEEKFPLLNELEQFHTDQSNVPIQENLEQANMDWKKAVSDLKNELGSQLNSLSESQKAAYLELEKKIDGSADLEELQVEIDSLKDQFSKIGKLLVKNQDQLMSLSSSKSVSSNELENRLKELREEVKAEQIISTSEDDIRKSIAEIRMEFKRDDEGLFKNLESQINQLATKLERTQSADLSKEEVISIVTGVVRDFDDVFDGLRSDINQLKRQRNTDSLYSDPVRPPLSSNNPISNKTAGTEEPTSEVLWNTLLYYAPQPNKQNIFVQSNVQDSFKARKTFYEIHLKDHKATTGELRLTRDADTIQVALNAPDTYLTACEFRTPENKNINHSTLEPGEVEWNGKNWKVTKRIIVN